MKSERPSLFGFVCLLASTITAPAVIQNDVLTNFWFPDGPVHAIAEVNGTVYIGGAFNYVGPFTGSTAFFDSISGARDAASPQTDAAIRVAISDGAGGWFIGGDFGIVGDTFRASVAHILPDKTVDQAWDARLLGGSVRAMALSGNTLYLGGTFILNIGGQERHSLAAVNAATGALLPWNANPIGFFNRMTVSTMAVSGGSVFIGGGFTNVGGLVRTNLAAVDAASGAALPWNPNPDFGVSALLVEGNTLYVAGSFRRIGGQTRTNLAALNTTSGNALAWPADSPDASVSSMALSGNALYIAGIFTRIGSVTNSGVGAISTTTGTRTSWNPRIGVVASPAQGGASQLAILGNTVYVGGTFNVCGGQTRLRLAAIDATTGNVLANWNPSANASVTFLAASGNRVLASGFFTSVGGVQRNALAALDTTTGAATSWDANANYYAQVYSLVASNNVLFVGGAYTNIGGQPRQSIAALNLATGAATAWYPGAVVSPTGINNIYAMLLSGQTLYIGGSHFNSGGAARTNAAALDTVTGSVLPWNPNANSAVRAFAQGHGVIYAGGSFTRIGGQQITNLAALNPNTGEATGWNPRADRAVYALCVDADRVYAAGIFTSIGGQRRTNFAALDPVTATLLAFPDPTYSFDGNGAYALALRDTNALLVGGAAFGDIGGAFGYRLLELNTITGTRADWYPAPERPFPSSFFQPVRTITVGTDKIFVGGEFGGGFVAYPLPDPPAPGPQLTMPLWSGGSFQFRLLGEDGLSYFIEATDDLGVWNYVDFVAPVGGFIDVIDPNASGFNQRIYRAYAP